MLNDKEISFAYAHILLDRITEDLVIIGFDDAEWQSFSGGYEMHIGGVCIARGVDQDSAAAAEDLLDALAWVFAQAPVA
jgi:hypothetical protein